MYRVIDGNDTGKTRKLLTECGTEGLFVCAHPERTRDKCIAYGIPQVRSIGYGEYIENNIKITSENTRPVYIDELEKFVRYMVPYLAGYTLSSDK